ncbi:MAG: hypothetical protein A2W31_05945 [Planctomycetes bacterium RBG_16_64_10]|nr:MAG: hypothetical protein A2W31_05945 [Planctomycetes bacterium RBG_16_64_10]
MTPLETDHLSDLIARKRACLAELRDLGRRQMALIETGSMTQLLKVLAAKQHLIGVLQGIEQALAPFRDQDPQQRRWRSPADRAQCAEQADLCGQLLREIVAQEKESEGRMLQRRDEAAARLRHVHAAAQARGAYQDGTAVRTGMLDLASEG